MKFTQNFINIFGRWLLFYHFEKTIRPICIQFFKILLRNIHLSKTDNKNTYAKFLFSILQYLTIFSGFWEILILNSSPKRLSKWFLSLFRRGLSRHHCDKIILFNSLYIISSKYVAFYEDYKDFWEMTPVFFNFENL